MDLRFWMGILGGISLVLFLISLKQVSVGKFGSFEPELWGFGLPYGAFIWGDLLIFSGFWTLASAWIWRMNDVRYFWIVFFIVYLSFKISFVLSLAHLSIL